MAELSSGKLTFLLANREGGLALSDEAPTVLHPAPVRHNLPAQPTALLGREREVADIQQLLLRDDGRHVTLTGPGGTGKTRLSLQVAANLAANAAEHFRDGVFLIDLAPITDAALVPAAIAQVLGVWDMVNRPVLEGLKEYVRRKWMLLVLDNFEQILPAAPIVAELLKASPGLKVLVTSREPLYLRGEREYAVPTLPLPDPRHPASTAELTSYAAVALFAERASEIRADFILTPESAPVIAEICARLDGLPLAIELAAARIRLLTPQAMLARLERRLPLLTHGAQDLPARQRTLRDAIAWSYDLLSAREQVLFRRLAIFVGGCTLEAAEAIAMADVGDHLWSLGPDEVLEGIESLIAKNLLRRVAESGPGAEAASRITMLETVREYGIEALERAGELQSLRRWHARYFSELAEQSVSRLRGHEQTDWLDRLEAEHANLRAALAWSFDTSDQPDAQTDTALRMCGALAWFWATRAHASEGHRWLVRVLAVPASHPAARLRALYGAGWLAHVQRDVPAAQRYLEAALVLAQELGDTWATAWSLHLLGRVAYFESDVAAARAYGEQSLAAAREAGDDWLIAWALHLLGLAAHIAADYDTARAYYEDALQIRRRLGFKEGIGVCQVLLAIIAYRQGDHAGSFTLARACLLALREVGAYCWVHNALATFVSLAIVLRQPDRAVRLAGAISAFGESVAVPPIPMVEQMLRHALEAARRELGDTAYATSWEEGHGLSLEAAIAEALDVEALAVEAPSIPGIPDSLAAPTLPSAATTIQQDVPRHDVPTEELPRETGVLRLPASGRISNHALTSFIGREQEIAEATRLLSTTRLLTLTGTGGVGKTRLGQEVAARLLDAFPGGVRLVELAALADPALVPQAVATVLGVREEAERPLTETLAHALRAEQLLLLLDNCEHLVEACATLADALLRACPGLQILATSHQPLGIAGETTLRVASLALPAPRALLTAAASSADRRGAPAVPMRPSPRGADSPIDLATQPEAVRLFVERSRAVVPSFTLTDRNLSAVEQICQRLDGIPLAIELASARVAVLSPEQIAGRLDDRFDLLSGARQTALPRYRTLRALVDWSHDLLNDRERVLFRRLAVFAGGWTLEAAESVCADHALAPDEILNLLAELVAKSLVLTVEHADEVRYRFLETLRAYATEKLRDAGEETMLRDRHCAWHLAIAERAAPELIGPRQEVWLDRLDRERENLRVAQRWAVTQGDAETMARLGAALWQFWWARADAADAREWINATVPLARQVQPTRALAEALHGAGMLAGSLAEYATCRSLLREALVAARQVGDRYTLASVLDSLGRQLSFEGHYAESHQYLTEALAILRQLDNRQALARALSRFGFLKYLEGDHESARATLEEGLAVAREACDPAMIAEICDKLGQMFQSDGDLDAAVRAFQQAEPIWRELGQGHWLAMTLNNLGNAQTLRGELDKARVQLAEALGLAQRMGNRRRMAYTISSIATLAALEGDPERALCLDAVSSAAVAEMGIRRVPPKVPLRAQHLERARETLGESASAAAGRSMTLAQAVDESLIWLADLKCSAHRGAQSAPEYLPRPRAVLPEPPVPAAAGSRSAGPAGLSPRETEVLRLLASGRTSKEVADDLVLSIRTVERHTTHIYEKIGARGRADATLFALKHGLI